MGAFLLVVAASALVFATLTYRSTRSAFSLYTTRSGQLYAERLAPVLEAYYLENQGWQGVETLLQTENVGNTSASTTEGTLHEPAGQGRGRGQGQGIGSQAGSGQGSMWAILGQRLILADAQGEVIADSADQIIGQILSSNQLELGAPLQVNGSLVGSLLVTPGDTAGQDSPAAQFLASVNRSIVLSLAISGVIAMILGALLFFQIMSPLRRLNKAAGAIEQGDLSQRVEVNSQDELGRLSQSFNRMTDSLERSETQRQRLLADISHELRTPIAVIQANLEALLDGVLPLDGEQVATLYDETLLLNRLVDDLRLLSQAEAGQLKLNLQEADLAGFMFKLVERFKVQAQENSVRLGVELPPELPRVWMDGDRITQVLNNLVGNALRYTPPGGFIQIKAEAMKGGVRISVTDNGSGIPAADLPFVFDRFYRADPSRTRVSGGSGLGLAIVKQLVEAHGGKVEAISPVFGQAGGKGYGTKIEFILLIE